MQVVAGHQQRLTEEAVQVHAGFEALAGDDVLIDLVAVAADAGVHVLQVAVSVL